MTTYHTVSWVRLMVVLENSRGGKNLLGNYADVNGKKKILFFLFVFLCSSFFVCLFIFFFYTAGYPAFFGDYLVIMGMNCIDKATKTFNVETSRSKILRNTVYGCMVVD